MRRETFVLKVAVVGVCACFCGDQKALASSSSMLSSSSFALAFALAMTFLFSYSLLGIPSPELLGLRVRTPYPCARIWACAAFVARSPFPDWPRRLLTCVPTPFLVATAFFATLIFVAVMSSSVT